MALIRSVPNRSFAKKSKIAENLETPEVIANPELVGTEPDLTGLEVNGTKYKVPEETEIIANPELEGDEPELEGLQIGDVKYAIPAGGSGGGGTALYKHSMSLSFSDPDLPGQTVSHTVQWLSKYETPYVENGTLVEMLSYYSELSDAHGLMNPMLIIDNVFAIVSQILPDSNGINISVVAGTSVFTYVAAFTDNTNITDTVTPYITGGGTTPGDGNKIYTYKVEFPNAIDSTKTDEFVFSLNENALKDNEYISLIETIIGASLDLNTLAEDYNTLSSQYKGALITVAFIPYASDCFLTYHYREIEDVPVDPITKKVLAYDAGTGFIVEELDGSSTGTVATAGGDFTMTLIGIVGGGNGGSESNRGIDYIEILQGDVGNQLIFTFEKGALNSSDVANPTNALITAINTNLGLSIPSYTTIEDIATINDYLNTLSDDYIQVKVIFYSALFTVIKIYALSIKGGMGDIYPILIKSIFNDSDEEYEFEVKYLDDTTPVAYATLFNQTNFIQLRIYVNNFD